ncbi:hypothetical protein [Gloeobacter morelensis]|uniref:hypothetical protein n=1 Tax=Gloeobacter morelensis TaxID=2907343 RepID=UPI001E2EDD99|nr:hypothetical protein [Gloeobacter morelensis]
MNLQSVSLTAIGRERHYFVFQFWVHCCSKKEKLHIAAANLRINVDGTTDSIKCQTTQEAPRIRKTAVSLEPSGGTYNSQMQLRKHNRNGKPIKQFSAINAVLGMAEIGIF